MKLSTCVKLDYAQHCDLNKLKRLDGRETVHLTLFQGLQKPSMLGVISFCHRMQPAFQPSQETLERKVPTQHHLHFLYFPCSWMLALAART